MLHLLQLFGASGQDVPRMNSMLAGNQQNSSGKYKYILILVLSRGKSLFASLFDCIKSKVS